MFSLFFSPELEQKNNKNKIYLLRKTYSCLFKTHATLFLHKNAKSYEENTFLVILCNKRKIFSLS